MQRPDYKMNIHIMKTDTSLFTFTYGKELLQMFPVPQSHLYKSLNNCTFLMMLNNDIKDVRDH